MQRDATPCAAPDLSTENLLPEPLNHFVKDGRIIEVGDCALFQSQNSPPFIGIILSFHRNYQNAPEKPKNFINLSVNWLYRPSDVKLSKGNLLEAAPNEVFYSFHRDIVPADSLLHPCKVSFLRRGVELQNGVSSFVCRRVYDIENKRLWWLTDKNYINERQAEVNKLLDKTQSDMNISLSQTGNKQSKSLNSPRASQTGQDDPNGSPSFPYKAGRKRDLLTLQPIKRDPDPFASAIEQDSNNNNNNDNEINNNNNKTDANTNTDPVQSEISKITEMGGLTSNEAVEKLLNLMQSDRTEKKLDLTGRVKLAGIIASTDPNFTDPLVKFVQMRGVAVLDEWLQEAHKSTKETDIAQNKGVEELLFALLRALEKLPINLNALRMCNIGKSVNHLRGHKNVEVQKKARFLVDTWKRRVDAEMKANELKTGQAQLGGTSRSVQAIEVSAPDLSPNSSSSFGSVKTASRSGKPRSANGQAQTPRTGTGTGTVPDSGIGHRIVVRLNSGRSAGSEDPLATLSNSSSPVRVHQVQGGKLKRNDVKEENAGSDEGNSEKCTGTGTVPVPTGDDLGMLAIVATGEITKSDNKKEPVKEEPSNTNNSCSKNNDKNDKNNNKNDKEEPEGKNVVCEKTEENRPVNGQIRPVTGNRIVVRLNSGRSAVSDDPLKRNDVKEEMVGSEEGSSEKCTGTGTGSVPVPVLAGDDLGMLASVATGEITKLDSKKEVVNEEGLNGNKNDEENDKDDNNNDKDGYKNEKNNNKIDKDDKESKKVVSEKPDETNNVKSENKEGFIAKEPVPIPPKEELTSQPPDKKETVADVAEGDASTSAAPESSTKIEFDLNEDIPNTDSDMGATSAATPLTTQQPAANYFSFLNPPFAPKVTVGPFLSQENLLRPVRGSEMGRVGSGPISAFRPAEPRKGLEMSIGPSCAKKPVLEFDLNVADEEEEVEQNSFDLDLNKTDTDPGPSGFKGIDLNGPGLGPVDESGSGTGTAGMENLIMSRNQFPRGTGPGGNFNNNIPFLPQPTTGHNNMWFSAQNPSLNPYQISAPFSGTGSYRGHAFVYPGQNQNQIQSQFPFGIMAGTGTGGPYQSVVPTTTPQMVGAGLSLSTRPYFVGLPEGSSSSSGVQVGVGRPGAGGLDLNAEPGGPGAGSSVDQVYGGKRKEPEGGWERDRERDRERKQFWQ